MEQKPKMSGPNQGVGEFAKKLIRGGMTNAEVLERVRSEFPTAKTSANSVNWYRSKMRHAGEPILGNLELRRRREESPDSLREQQV